MPRKDTKEEFIAKARAMHGDKYNYNNVEYIDNNTKVNITCPIHGDFPQTPHNHKAGQGCPYCVGNKKQTTKEFIEEAVAVHGNKYSYDKVKYVNAITDVLITCLVHGDFPQKPCKHLNGCGCPECAKEKKRKTKEEFIRDAINVHGNKYNYDKVEFVDTKTKVMITCPIHGDFPMTPNNHTSMKQGCPDCAREAQIKTTEEFIARAREIHGDKYNYGKVEYSGILKKVIITCPTHGDFPQVANNHLNGCGCPRCNQSHLEREVSLILEKHNIKYETEKTFYWLRNKREMPLDFYLPEYNIAIECQGIQHYLTEGNGYFTTNGIKSTQDNDKLKYSLCQEYGISIYYVKYNDNVEERINEILK